MYSTDKRWQQLGELLVNYSTGVQPGERVMIAMGEVESFPLVRAVYEAAIRAGAFPQVQFLSETLRHALLKHGTAEQAGWTPEIEAYGMAWADVYFGIRGAHNLHEHWDVAAGRVALSQAAQGKISALRWQQTRWCLARVPNPYFAQQAEADLDTIMDMFLDACLIDWPVEAEKWRSWAEKLGRTSEIRIAAHDTDLSFSVAGRRWLAGDGKINMPDGEVFTAPVPETVDGQIYFEHPAVLGSTIFRELRLRWQQGVLVEATSSTNQDVLRAIVRSDAGASRIGEFAFGANPALTHFCTDMLIDEKIGGTVHIALGRAYPACGGDNASAIHWDIVKDTRPAGCVYADGVPVLRDGAFLL